MARERAHLDCPAGCQDGALILHEGQTDHPYYHLWKRVDRERRTPSYFFRDLLRQRTLPDFLGRLADLYLHGISNWGCDGWHVIPCPECADQ